MWIFGAPLFFLWCIVLVNKEEAAVIPVLLVEENDMVVEIIY